MIVALDYARAEDALGLVARLDPGLCRLKVGKELFTTAGPTFVEGLVARGFDVFLDLKFHDIPNTVAQACKAAARLGVWMLNVHGLGGRRMLSAARESLEGLSSRPKLIAVTVLTSMGREDLQEIGIADEPQAMVLRLAKLAQSSGLDGVVCSAHEAPLLKHELGAGFCLVTPGIRLAASSQDDQVRVTTPREAVRLGADYLVIGRPITQAKEPLQVLQDINQELA
ncbi:MAG: orotidine-5'-phosphate decarboxylase, partial [Methanoregulaceae archaeon]|nr:orotidine-5'-phosphate decarboxylase [Methanoregulaceae archaeon]